MPRHYYLEDLALDEAQQRFAQALAGGVAPLATERVPLAVALGRVTARAVWANLSSPHYHAAAMDGIAVRAADTVGASERAPRQLLLNTQATWVDTGDPLPAGCDAMIMAEQVQELDATTVEIRAAVAPWQHVRPLGEDMVATELVLPENQRLRPVDLGALAAAGHAQVAVRRQPVVAIIPTGSELVLPEDARDLQPGSIIEFNSLMLAGLVSEWGGVAQRHAPVPDHQEQLRAAVRDAAASADIVVINAGSSAGSEDYTAAIIGELGKVAVHGVAMKPGHPVILGVVSGKPVLGLPGYPVSAVLTAEVFLRPLVFQMQGISAPPRPTVQAIASRKLLSPLGEDEFVRVTLGAVDSRMIATPLTRGAGVITSLMRADGLLRIPRFSEGVHAGEQVTVELLREAGEIERTIVATGSHDIALDLLASHIRRRASDTRFVSANVGSLGGLIALKRGDAHMAGTHLLDEQTGDYNRAYITRLLPEAAIVLVTLARRQQGLIVPRGNPHNLHELADLLQAGVQFINRQKGSGTRVLLDFHLRQHGISPETVSGYEREEFTHMAVAAAIHSRAADVGLGILAAARALDLDFIPLFDERYDLAIPCRYWESALLAPLRATLADTDYRTAVAALGGYDVAEMGKEQ